MTNDTISRAEYESKKKDVTQKVTRVIDSEVADIVSTVDFSIKDFMSALWDNRKNRAIKNGRLRDMTVYLTLDAFGVNNLEKNHLNVIAAGEFYNMASYYQNWHLDDKKNVKGGFEAKLCHIASHLYREKAHELVMKTNFSSDIKLQLLQELSESNKAIQIGQSLEMAGAKITDAEHKSEDEVIDIYTKRCEGMSGRFYGASFAMGAIMAEASDEHTSICRNTGTMFGTGLQMINDVGDFCLVPSLVQLSEKDYQDQFADLMKGTMTLPVLELSKTIDMSKYHSRELSHDEKTLLLKRMVKNNAFHKTRRITNALMRNMIREVKKIKTRKETKMLKYQIKTMFQCNKFYVNLRENHGYKWGV